MVASGNFACKMYERRDGIQNFLAEIFITSRVSGRGHSNRSRECVYVSVSTLTAGPFDLQP